MDKIKTVKIKNPDGSISEETYTISVDSINVDMENGRDLQDTIGDINIDEDGNIAEQLKKYKKYDSLYSDVDDLKEEVITLNTDIKKKTYFFNTVAEMKADTRLKNGDMVTTLGYYEPNDGGGAEYKIVSIESQTDYQEELENQLYATLIIDNEINLNAIGLSSDLEDNTPIFNKAIEYALNNNISKLKIYKQDEYNIKGPIVLFNGLELEGSRSRLIKTNNSKYNNINTILYFKTYNSNFNYCEDIKVYNIKLYGNSLTDYGIYYEVGGTRTVIEDVSISTCKYGIKTNNIWVCTFNKILIYNCSEIGFICGTNATTLFINEIYCLGCKNGFKFVGVVYSNIGNLACDFATDTAYYFEGSNFNIGSLGSESPKALNILYFMNSTININSGYLYANTTDSNATLIVSNGSKVNLTAVSLGRNANADLPGKFIAFGTNSNIILNSCRPSKYKFLTKNSGSSECTLTVNNDNKGGTYTQNRYSLAPIYSTDYFYDLSDYSLNGKNVKEGNIWFNSYNSPMSGIDSDNSYSKNGKVGDLFVNQGNNKTGIAMFQQRDLENQIYIVNPVSNISNNNLIFESILYDNEATKCGFVFNVGDTITNNNGATGTITAITSTSLTVTTIQGTFAKGDTIYSSKVKYMRDVHYGVIQQVLLGTTSERPTVLSNWSKGIMFFDTTLGKPIWYTGSKWVDATGVQV